MARIAPSVWASKWLRAQGFINIISSFTLFLFALFCVSYFLVDNGVLNLLTDKICIGVVTKCGCTAICINFHSTNHIL